MKTYMSIREVLGGPSVVEEPITSYYDLDRLSKSGITKASVSSVSSYLGISLENMCAILHISPRTIQRKTKSEPLGIHTSEQTIEVAEVVSKGLEVFEDAESFRKWLNQSLVALHGKKPIELLDTSFGTKLLMEALGRLQHGVYA